MANNTSNTTNTGNSSGTSSTTQGGQTSQRQALSPSATQSTSRTEGTRREHTASIAYPGQGLLVDFSQVSPNPNLATPVLQRIERHHLGGKN